MLKKISLTTHIYTLLFTVLSLAGVKSSLAQCTVSIGADTQQACIGDTIQLNAGAGFVSYQWSSPQGAATTQTLKAFTTGTYRVTVDNGTTTCADTAYIIINPLPSVNLGTDDTICFGTQKTLQAGSGFASYTWNDGTSIESLIVTLPDTYSVTVTDANSCTKTDSIIINQHSLPVVSAGNDTSICKGDTITFTATAGFTTYSWNTGASTQSIQADTGGFYSVTITDGNGCNNSNGVTLTIDSLPTVNIGNDDTICIGANKFLNAGGGFTSYTWNTSATNQTITVTNADTYWVKVVDTNSCVNSDTMFLYHRNGPAMTLGNDTFYCANDSVRLKPLPGGYNTYSWSNATNDSVLFVSATGSYSVTVTDLMGCSTIDTISVSQKALPVVSIGGNIEYCQGNVVNQIISGGNNFTNYLWMDGVTSQTNTITQADDTVWVQVTDTNGCVNRDTLYVIQNAKPVLNLGPDDTICANQTKILNAGTSSGTITSYSWSTSANSQSITLSFNPTTITTPTTNTYSVTVSNIKNCTSADTINLLINPIPSPNLGPDTSYCFGDPFSMTLNPGTFTTYSWNTGATSATYNIGAVAAVYTVTVTDANGCQNHDNINIIEHVLPTPNLGNDTSFCEGTNINKIIAPGIFKGYLWGDGSTQPFLNVIAADTYKVTVTDLNGCKNSDEIIFTELKNPKYNLTPDKLLCEGDTVNTTLTVTPVLVSSSYAYSWSTGASSASIPANDTGTYKVTITNNANACVVIDSTRINYFPKAIPNLGADGILCEGEAFELNPKVTLSGYNYLWSTGANTPTISVLNSGTYWVELNAINGTCIGIRDTISLKLGALPIVELGEDKVLCQGQHLKLLDKTTAFPDSKYVWQDGSTDSEYTAKQSGIYRVVVSNKCGSVVDEMEVLFQDCYNVYVPNTFTPNGDDKNEFFQIYTEQELLLFSFWVYDRYGHLVFKTNNPHARWDGKVNGEDAPSGMYIWRISYISAFDEQKQRREKIGQVNLIR